MNHKTKAEHIFIILILCMVCLSALCLAGCGGSCFGCSCSFDKEKEEGVGSASGLSCISGGCIRDDACISVGGCLDIAEIDEETSEMTGIDNVTLISCETVKNGACGGSSCYRGCYYANCENYGCIRGSTDNDKMDDCAVGCIDGAIGCNDSDGSWHSLLEAIYKWLGIGR